MMSSAAQPLASSSTLVSQRTESGSPGLEKFWEGSHEEGGEMGGVLWELCEADLQGHLKS